MGKKTLYYFILLVISLAVAGVLLFDKIDPSDSQVENPQQQRLSKEGSNNDLGQPRIEPQSPVNLVRNRDFYRQLAVGDQFPLLLDGDGVNSTVEVRVSAIRVEANAISIRGSLGLSEEGSVLITMGEKFTHIFVSANRGIFEYSGKDFQGLVTQTKDMRLADDIAIPQQQAVELFNPKLQQLKTVDESQ
ncbi:MAG: hypothetical protein P8H28_02685 [Porticoccaceae bacterium]|nr:hypothetical protein [Porticoccaceae bacterium]